jgi:hypothetical protein
MNDHGVGRSMIKLEMLLHAMLQYHQLRLLESVLLLLLLLLLLLGVSFCRRRV